jgi:tetratricopeptide (TPR) repeat protein
VSPRKKDSEKEVTKAKVTKDKKTDEGYERPTSGPGSQALNPSLRQTIAFGNAAWEQDDFATAYEHFRAILQDHPNFADIRNRAGLCLAMMGNSEGALEEFDEALKVNDCYSEALLNRAIVLNDLGRHDEAAECFHRASALDLRDSRVFPSHMGNQLANAHARTGDLYMAADRPEEAAAEYAAAVEVRPGFLDLRFKLAEAYMDLEMLGEARGHLEEILATNADFAGARVRLGALLLRMDDKAGARREWERCAEQNPDDRRIQAYLASLES